MISNTSHVSQLGTETKITTKERKKFHYMNCRQSGLEFRKNSLNARLGNPPSVLRCMLKITSGSLVKGAQDKYRS